jgi:tripartite-type tricarboxylate transporter receptor subunit TctC
MSQPSRAPDRPAHRTARRALARALSVGAIALAALPLSMPGAALASETWPAKPIRFVVPYPPGGPLDQVARLLAEALREPLGQTLIVENRPGAGGNLGADHVAKSPPDGYSIVMGAVATHAINPYLYAKMPYDANRDFTPITRVATVPNVLIMNADTAAELRIGSVADLIAHARANPGKLNYASGGNGSAGHLAGELFKSMAKVSMVHIPYKGAAPAQLGLLGGQTDLMFDNLASATPQIRAGKLKAFAVTTAQRSGFFPEIPTVAESGLPGFDISTWFGVFGPAGMPPAIVDRLNTAFGTALASKPLRDRLAAMGAEPSPLSPAAFGEFVRAEQKKYERVVKASGARID